MSASKTDRQFMKDAQVGELGSTAMVSPSGEVSKAHQRVVEWNSGIAATTAATTYNVALCTFDRAVKIISCTVTAAAALTGSDTVYETLNLVSNDGNGGAQSSAICGLTTKLTGGTGSWSANKNYAMSAPVSSLQGLASGSALYLTITPASTGTAIPAGTCVTVVYEEV